MLILLSWLHFGWGSVGLDWTHLGLASGYGLNPVFLMCLSSSWTAAKLLIAEAWEAKPYPLSTFQNCLQLVSYYLKSHMTGSKTKGQRSPIPHKESWKGINIFSTIALPTTFANFEVLWSSQHVRSVNCLMGIFPWMYDVIPKGHYFPCTPAKGFSLPYTFFIFH